MTPNQKCNNIFSKVYPRQRSIRSTLTKILFNYNHTCSYRTKTGKDFQKPCSLETVNRRITNKTIYWISAQKWKDHYDKVIQLYGYNSPNTKTPYHLWMIDVDLTDKTLDVRQTIQSELGIEIAWEQSPSKNWHGYFFQKKGNVSADHLAEQIDILNEFLNSLFVKYNWQDKVKELKIIGKAHQMDWKTWQATKQYQPFQIPQTLTAAELFNASLVEVRYWADPYWQDQTRLNNQSKPVVRKVKNGSCDFCIGADQLDQLSAWRKTVKSAPEIKVGGKSRAVATAEDLAIFCFIVEQLQQYQGDDMAMPTNWIISTWQQLYQSGLVDRAPSKNRIAAMRSYLGSVGGNEYFDRTYYVGYKDEQGKYQQGKAARWTLSEQLIDSREREEDYWYNTISTIIDRDSIPVDLKRSWITPNIQLARFDRLTNEFELKNHWETAA